MPSPAPLPPLTQVHATLRHAASASVASLPHVADLISACLDGSSLVAPARAAASGVPGLFTRVAHRLLDARVSRGVREYYFSLSLEAALRADDLTMTQAIHDFYPEPLAVKSFEMAMAHGSLELVQWVLTHRHDRSCCAGLAWNLCRSCAQRALEVIGARDTFRIATWLIHDVILTDPSADGAPTGPRALRESDEVVSYLGQALLLSAEFLRWFGDQGLLTRQAMGELLDQTFSNLNHASAGIVRYLLEKGYAPTIPEYFTQYPIRAACRVDQEELVELILASSVCDSFRHEFTYSPLHPGGAKVLRWSREFDKNRVGVDIPNIKRITTLAFTGGHRDMVEWLVHEHGVRDIELPDDLELPEDVCLSIVTFLHDARALGGEHIMDTAAEKGFLRVIKWLHENRDESCTEAAMDLAAACGHLHVVQWLHANRTEGCTQWALNEAASNGHLSVVRWLMDHRRMDCDVTKAMSHAATKGQLEVLMWLHENGQDGCVSCVRRMLRTKFQVFTVVDNLQPNVLYTLEWLDQQNDEKARTCKDQCVSIASYFGDTCFPLLAAGSSHILLLNYLHVRDREWPSLKRQDHFELLRPHTLPALQWLYAHRRDWCDWRSLVADATMADRAIREWLCAHVLDSGV